MWPPWLKMHLLLLASTHLLIFQEEKKPSGALSCYQLSMLILVQNKDYSNRMKPLFLADSQLMFWCNIHSIFVLHIICELLFFAPDSFVFFLLATWCKYFHTDNHLWFTTVAQLSQHLHFCTQTAAKHLILIVFTVALFCSAAECCRFEEYIWLLGQRCSPRGGDMPGQGQHV